MTRPTAEQIGKALTDCDDLDMGDVVLSMTIVRAARWHIEASVDGRWRTVYEGPSFLDAIHAVQDHDETRVSYLYGTWREIND